MKTLTLIVLLFTPLLTFAQPDTEVYLFDLTYNNGTYTIANPVNISDNPGYDSQPSFTPGGRGILFSSTRNGQTDAVLYSITAKTKTWLSDSPGGEYSPTVMPNGTHFSTIILKPDGEQLLWKYPLDGSGVAEVIVPDLVIGYHTWLDQNTIFSFVLGEPATLQKNDLSAGTNTVLVSNPGRSLHKIPGTNTISYVDKSDENNWVIKSYYPANNSTTTITNTIPGSEDMAWSQEGFMFMGSGSTLYIYNPESDETGWESIADLSSWNLDGISRIAISPRSNKIAIVVNK